MILLLLLRGNAALAGETDVVSVEVDCNETSVCQFAATVKHEDEGWEHYADRWEVVAADEVLATRVLRHPHVDEQPFQRRLSGVKIPPETTTVTVRAHDSVHGYGGREVAVEIPQ